MKTFAELPQLHSHAPQCLCPVCKKRWRECACEWTETLRGKIPNAPHEGRPWGFKGTMEKPPGWNTKKPRPVLTPDHWRHLSLVPDGKRFSLVSFATQSPLLRADLDAVKIPARITTRALPRDEALAVGERIEKAFAHKLKPPEKKRKEKERKFPLDAEQREWHNSQTYKDND